MTVMHILLITDPQRHTIVQPLWFDGEVSVVHIRNPRHLPHKSADVMYDNIVLDIEQLGATAFRSITALRQRFPYTPLIVLSPHMNRPTVQRLIRQGITGILLRDDFSNDSSHFLQTVAAGKLVISPRLMRTLASG